MSAGLALIGGLIFFLGIATLLIGRTDHVEGYRALGAILIFAGIVCAGLLAPIVSSVPH